MKIEIQFNEPVSGYWDGGKKSGGTFDEDRYHRLDDKHTAFGSYELNHFFNVKTGRTEKETISRAKRYLKKHTRRPFSFI